VAPSSAGCLRLAISVERNGAQRRESSDNKLPKPRRQLTRPREGSTEDDAETGPQADPNRVARESEENGSDSGAEYQAHTSRNGRSALLVLLVNHGRTLQACRRAAHAVVFDPDVDDPPKPPHLWAAVAYS
jgi:hypothetical protein